MKTLESRLLFMQRLNEHSTKFELEPIIFTVTLKWMLRISRKRVNLIAPGRISKSRFHIFPSSFEYSLKNRNDLAER